MATVTAMTTCQVALCTCPDEPSATQLARALVDEQLAACVNRLPGATSTYRWDGRVEEDTETLLIIKTTADALPRLRQRVATLHPYDVPELIALSIADGLPEYLHWLQQEVS